MASQLLWIETLLKFTCGVVLLMAPITAARLLGLPHGNVGFWPRLLGALLAGLAFVIYLEGASGTGGGSGRHAGISLTGIAIINATTVAVLLACIVLRLVKPVRGIVVLWSIVLVLFGLAVLELTVS